MHGSKYPIGILCLIRFNQYFAILFFYIFMFGLFMNAMFCSVLFIMLFYIVLDKQKKNMHQCVCQMGIYSGG